MHMLSKMKVMCGGMLVNSYCKEYLWKIIAFIQKLNSIPIIIVCNGSNEIGYAVTAVWTCWALPWWAAYAPTILFNTSFINVASFVSILYSYTHYSAFSFSMPSPAACEYISMYGSSVIGTSLHMPLVNSLEYLSRNIWSPHSLCTAMWTIYCRYFLGNAWCAPIHTFVTLRRCVSIYRIASHDTCTIGDSFQKMELTHKYQYRLIWLKIPYTPYFDIF